MFIEDRKQREEEKKAQEGEAAGGGAACGGGSLRKGPFISRCLLQDTTDQHAGEVYLLASAVKFTVCQQLGCFRDLPAQEGTGGPPEQLPAHLSASRGLAFSAVQG